MSVQKQSSLDNVMLDW